MRKIPRPNLFIVGAPRCGTTTLYGYLDRHPQVFMPDVKEPHYFCRDLREACDAYHGRESYFPFRTEQQYLELYARAGDQPVRGDASVYYLLSRSAPAEIHAFDPGARIVVMLREPLSFLRSLHAKLRLMGDEEVGFAEALRLEPERLQGRRIPHGVRLPSFLHYRDAARFAEHLCRYRALFPPEQIKVVLLDDFRRDTPAVLNEVQEFLGIERRQLPEPPTLNENREARWRRLTLWTRSLEIAAMELSRSPQFAARRWTRRLPRRLLMRAAGLIDSLNTRPARRLPLAADLQAELRAELRPGVEELGELLQRDLIGLWGY